MDVLRQFYRDHSLLVKGACVAILLSIVINILRWKMKEKMLEAFQDTATAIAMSEKERNEELQHLPIEIREPQTPPMYQQENCATIQKTIDAMKLTELSKKGGIQEFANSQIFQSQKRIMEDHFAKLSCKEYLEKITAGEIPAPITPSDMRPDILPSQM